MLTNKGKATYTKLFKGVQNGDYDLPLPHELREAEAAGQIKVDRTKPTWVKMPGTGQTGILQGETVTERPKSLTFEAELIVKVSTS